MRLEFFDKIKKDPKAWVKKAFPICEWLPKYRKENIPFDIIAGMTVGLTLLPISLAYAQMAYLRPEFGLYSSFIAQFVYIFIGTSKDAIVGPSAIGSMLLAQFNILNPLSSIGDNTYATMLAFSNGIILILVAIFKLGFIVNLFSVPVVSGFTSASCFAIIASQLKTFFGIRKSPYDSPGVFVKQIKNIYDHRDEIRILDVVFGSSSLAFLLIVEYSHVIFLKCLHRKQPPPTAEALKSRERMLSILQLIVASKNVIVFVVSTGLAYWLHSSRPNEMKDKLSVVGYIKPGFPTPQFPKFRIENTTLVFVANGSNGTGQWVEETRVLQDAGDIFGSISVGFLIMPLMAIMEMFAILKALGRKNGYRIDPTHELVALGLGNFLQSFYYAYPVTVATAKSALNDQCRVKSVLSTLASIFIILISIACLTEVFYYVPKAALSAILIAAAHHLFDYKAPVLIWREYKPDIFLFIATFILCLFYDLAYGILIAILFNMLTFLHPIVRMQLSIFEEPFAADLILPMAVPSGETTYVTVVQMSHGMKYPSVDKFIDKMTHLFMRGSVHFVLDCRFVSGFDFTGIQAWRMLLHLAYTHKKHLIFTNLSDKVRHQLDKIGLENFRQTENIEQAIGEFSLNATQVNGGGPQALMAVRRLRQSISVVSMQNEGGMMPMQRQISSISHRSAVLPEVVFHVPAINISDAENEDASDRREQEARLMKLLEHSAPNIFARIPISLGSNDMDDGIETIANPAIQTEDRQADDDFDVHIAPLHAYSRRLSAYSMSPQMGAIGEVGEQEENFELRRRSIATDKLDIETQTE